jgi:putative redox protein
MEAIARWSQRGLEFEGTSDSNLQIHMASSTDVGSPGFMPMELLGIGLAGCTAMDVISILMKKKQDVVDFEVLVHTRKADSNPKVWEWVQIEYVVTGRNIDPKAVERAMELSSHKYCPAQNMFKKAVDIELVYRIVEIN